MRRDIPLTDDLKQVIKDKKKMLNEFFGGNIFSFERLLFVNQKGNYVTSSDGNQAIRNVINYMPEDKKLIGLQIMPLEIHLRLML